MVEGEDEPTVEAPFRRGKLENLVGQRQHRPNQSMILTYYKAFFCF